MLDGHAGIITGAARGFGLAAAARLADDGAKVALVDVREEVAEAADALRVRGHEAIAIRADVATEDGTAHMVEAAAEALGTLTFIHQNAAIQVEKLLHETTLDEWDRVMAVNVRSMFLGARALIPRFKEGGGGAIVNSASVLSLSADEILPAYTASKHAVLGLTRAIAVTRDYAEAGIRCNAICPGDIETDMVRQYWAAQRDPEAAAAETKAHYPMGRIGSPQEMANVVSFLISERASFINGAAFTVDGGVMAKVY